MTSTLPIPSPQSHSMRSKEDDAPIAPAFARTLRAFAEKQQSDSFKPRLPLPTRMVEKKPLKILRSHPPGPMAIAKIKPAKRTGAAPPTDGTDPESRPSPPHAAQWLAQAWSWLQKRSAFSATKSLRVSETVSLGEKRFVAVVQVDGQKFLIGGSASSVSLLAELDTERSSEVFHSIVCAEEGAK